MSSPRFLTKNIPALLGVLAVATVIYGSHLNNEFHFDDSHTIVQNPYIRDLHNIPRFLVDPDITSVLPANRTWRPVPFIMLTVDYWLGHGLVPFWFRLTTLIWFLAQLVVLYGLARAIFDRIEPGAGNGWPAVMATALFGLHPVTAETVNYIIQSAEIQSALGVAAGLLMYAKLPGLRRWGLYLLPCVMAVLAKPPALVFPVFFVLYIWLIEEERPRVALRRSLPAIATGVALAVLSSRMVSKTMLATNGPAWDYRISQPLAVMRYFSQFFIPTGLSADTDHVALSSLLDDGVIQGFVFVAALIWAIAGTARRREMRPITFGLAWFLVALIPTSLMPLAEVENDHRMYFAFLGLAIAAPWAAMLWLRRHPVRPRAVAAVCGLVLTVFAVGAWHRSEVWKTDESLWRDTALASPHNGRGLMNYGLTLMARGDFAGAQGLLNRASTLLPDYYVLEINLGIVNASLNNAEEADKHFRRSLELAPAEASPKYYYARWLHQTGHFPLAKVLLQRAVLQNPSYADAWYLLMQDESDAGDAAGAVATARGMLAEFPTDAVARSWLTGAGAVQQTPEADLNR